MRMRIASILLLLSINLLALGFSRAQAEPLRVVATFSILGDVVQNIGGDHIDLTVLVGADGDTHSYEPVPAGQRDLSQAESAVRKRPGLRNVAR